jgi:hypothetical protein
VSPLTKKILIGTAVVLLLLFGGCLISAVLGASWLQQWGNGMIEQGQQADTEARTFATGRDQEACVVEGFRRDDACGETAFSCEISAGIFLQRCLELSMPVAGFCDGVPRQSELMPSVQWTTATCAARGHATSQPCTRLVPAIQRYCDAHAGR